MRYIGAVGRASIYHIHVSGEPEGTCRTDRRRSVVADFTRKEVIRNFPIEELGIRNAVSLQ